MAKAPIGRIAISVRGVVQGVGFRPFVYNAATRLGLVGHVRNRADTVEMEVQGPSAALEAFLTALGKPPAAARIDSLETADLALVADEVGFSIEPSSGDSAPGPTIPADLATCAECRAEILAPGQRRWGYAFTNCTNCGPRWSIIEGLPYDRPKTAMRAFTMCAACRAEYEDPADRRFHAQPIACPACGPALRVIELRRHAAAPTDALNRACLALREGQIVALKGLGGFQLLVDATSDAAVLELRRRKQRPDKPFAVLLGSLDDARRYCDVSAAAAEALESPTAPIVLLRSRGDAAPAIAPAVAPGNPYLGVMLPYTPLHHLLSAALGRPLVCTSGNLAEEPMAITTDDAKRRLGKIADVILTHDRPIVRPVDDSVARIGPEGLQVLRRARGFAPLPLRLDMLPADLPPILAVGGHLKNAIALNVGRSVVVGAHVGDLDSVDGVAVFERAIDDLLNFFRVAPVMIACDLHPDYASTRHAERLAARWNVPLRRVQHHHAHTAACMAEHGIEGPVLGLSWDGTGYEPDGTVWGGEALICRGQTVQRLGHLSTFPLPGGDRAAREPRRAALGLLYETLGVEGAERVRPMFAPTEWEPLLSMLAGGVNAPRTSSMGRLFDAVAALCGLGAAVSFEGQAAMALEFAADDFERAAYHLPLLEGSPAVLDLRPLVAALLVDLGANVPTGRISARFHNALADASVALAERAGCSSVALTGGCFQNARLTEHVRLRLLKKGYKVLLHRAVPPGDGGVALGQLYVAALDLASA